MALEIFMEQVLSQLNPPGSKQISYWLAKGLMKGHDGGNSAKIKKVQMNRISAEATILARNNKNNLDSMISKCGERKKHFSSKYLTSQSDL